MLMYLNENKLDLFTIIFYWVLRLIIISVNWIKDISTVESVLDTIVFILSDLINCFLVVITWIHIYGHYMKQLITMED